MASRTAHFPRQSSNALLVSGRESTSGHPIAVMGPQTGYFAPQILMDEDVHGPGIDARGAAFPGRNLYVQLGRGRDYAWSATSAGQDIIDTFAVPLCEPDGLAPTIDSMHYRFRGQCLPIEVLEKTNNWTPSPADDTPPGSETLHAERTKLGLITARATIGGKPVAYTRCARPTSTRPTRRSASPSSTTRRRSAAPPTSSAPRARSASRSTGSTSTTSTSRTSTPATTRCARRARARTSR